MDLGFIILCPDRNIAGLRNTLGSIRHHCYDRESIAVVGNDATAGDIKEFKEYCTTYKAKDTITSLINTGMLKLRHEWGFIVFGGSRFQPYVERKVATFIKTEKDVLFPVVDRRCDFVSGSFNGVLINRKFFEEIGEFPEATMVKDGMNDFEMAKMFWACDAIEKGVVFKGIVGLKII